MPKQHEILAIKSGLVGKVAKLISDLKDLFTNKRHHFTEELTVYKPLSEKEKENIEKQTTLQTTVPKELAWVGKEFAKLLDLSHTINLTNCKAVADVIVEGAVLLKDVPVTGLLELEKQVSQFKDLLVQVPTLDPVKGFTLDKNKGEGIYVAVNRVTSRTAKEPWVLTLAAATDKFPANVVEKSRDVIAGYKHEQEWSGMLTPAEKSNLLSRCEELTAALKAAQARANSMEAVSSPIGQTVVNYILGS